MQVDKLKQLIDRYLFDMKHQMKNATLASTRSFRQTNGSAQEQYPSYFYNEQQQGGSSSGGGGTYRQQYYDQQTYPQPNVGLHPTRIAN